MKRSWSTILLGGGLVAVLAVLAVLQYQWMSKINESEGEKARKDVREQADRFAEDFNKEIQNIYFNLQASSASFEKTDWGPFNERYDFWREKARYPELVKGIYFSGVKGDNDLRYDSDSRAFVADRLPADIAAVKERFSTEKTFTPVHEKPLLLAQPVHEVDDNVGKIMIRRTAGAAPVVPGDQPPVQASPKIVGYLLISLDEGAMVQRVLPEFAAKYFGDGEYKAAVVDNGGTPVYASLAGQTPDATAKLLDVSPKNFMFFGNRELVSSLNKGVAAGEKRADVVLNSRIETHSLNRVATTPANGDKVEITLKSEGAPRTTVFTATTRDEAVLGIWTLQVQHSAGSLDAFLASSLRRNLAFGFGLLFLLAAAVAAIIWSSQRAKVAAQRQIDFVSSVSHEFRTPLAVIYSAGENLSDGVAKAEGQVSRYGELIKGEGRKLSAMVEQILDFAGANSGRRKFSFADTEVSEIVDSALVECRSLIEERGFELETNISEGLPRINADKAALGQAIQNLIANSVKYSNGNRWIRVSASNGDGRVKIAVEDRGIGISKSDLRQIFEPFFRSKEVVDAQIHGNGLGLSLVKQIVTAHGGTVRAESEIGKGSKFTIDVPQG